MKTKEKSTCRLGAPNIACLPAGDDGNHIANDEKGAPRLAAAGTKTGLVEALSKRISGLCTCFDRLASRLHAQDIPSDVGTQLFAADSASGQSLDGRAMLRRHATPFVLPLTDSRFRDTKAHSKRGFRADDLGGAVDGVIHV
jgi:hypothetical protein